MNLKEHDFQSIQLLTKTQNPLTFEIKPSSCSVSWRQNLQDINHTDQIKGTTGEINEVAKDFDSWVDFRFHNCIKSNNSDVMIIASRVWAVFVRCTLNELDKCLNPLLIKLCRHTVQIIIGIFEPAAAEFPDPAQALWQSYQR